MGCYYCIDCDKYYCHHSTPCYEVDGGTICESCQMDRENEAEQEKEKAEVLVTSTYDELNNLKGVQK